MDINSLLRSVMDKKASDLHIIAGSPPVFRINTQLIRLGSQNLTPEESKELIESMLSVEQKARFQKEKELDVSYALPGLARFRVNVHYQRETYAASFRIIPTKIPTLEQLQIPAAVGEFAKEPRGLILVTGPTGSGKSTTQAAMINFINSYRKCHIITIEDPIEYLHANKESVIEQRELGADTFSFAEALKRVLRQDPDVILVGEMRDLETISTAITAAETGHLVISTLHTNDSVQAVDRIVDAFPPHQQQQIRLQLSMSLQGIIAQQLLPREDGSGMIAAIEVMRVTPGIRNIIRKAATHELYSQMEIGAKYGMKTMDSSLKELYQKKIITFDDAQAHAINQEQFMQIAH
ncbi:MAG: type IV pilus twitching motility protein PilT [bacterium]